MTHTVEFLEPAATDLIALYEWIEDAAGSAIADAYLARLKARCLTLADFPNRGTPRDDLRRGIRSLSFEGRMLIFYQVQDQTVSILHILSTARETPTLI